jgi:hypothetical protein
MFLPQLSLQAIPLVGSEGTTTRRVVMSDQKNKPDILNEILALTASELTPEEQEILESAPKTSILDSSSFLLAMIKAARRSKAEELVRQLF